MHYGAQTLKDPSPWRTPIHVMPQVDLLLFAHRFKEIIVPNLLWRLFCRSLTLGVRRRRLAPNGDRLLFKTDIPTLTRRLRVEHRLCTIP